MINFILEHLSGRFMNDKGKRMLLLTSLYVLVLHSKGQSADLDKLNKELNLVYDIKSINLATVAYSAIWGCRFEDFCKSAPIEKVFRYVMLRMPRWLNYRDSRDYSLEEDLTKLKSLLVK